MRKWTTLCPSNTNSASIQEILASRSDHCLSENEIWALITQTCHAIGDFVDEINLKSGNRGSSTPNSCYDQGSYSVSHSSLPRYSELDISLDSVICQSSGKILLLTKSPCQSDFTRNAILHRSQNDFEAKCIHSLGCLIQKCFNSNQVSSQLAALVSDMVNEALTLNGILQRIKNNNWHSSMPTTPFFIAQMSRSTNIQAMRQRYNTNNTISCTSMPQARTLTTRTSLILHDHLSQGLQVEFPLVRNATPVMDRSVEVEEEQIKAPLAEVEFSKLDTSCSSSSSNDEDLLTDPVVIHTPDSLRSSISSSSSSSSDNQNSIKANPSMEMNYLSASAISQTPVVVTPGSTTTNNTTVDKTSSSLIYSNIQRQTIESRKRELSHTTDSFQMGKQHPTTIRCQNNPSRLYRIVRPLTEIASISSSDSKRCIGPEFVVIPKEKEDRIINLTIHRNHPVVKTITVHMLNGQTITVYCDVNFTTAGEVLESVLSDQDIKESKYYSLSIKVKNSEEGYCLLSPETELHKISPMSWRDVSQRSQCVSKFDLYLRFKIFPDRLEKFRDPKNKHQLYLQFRQDIIEGLYHISQKDHFELGSLALQNEFGDFTEEIHGNCDYFLVQHYLPHYIISRIGSTECKQKLSQIHRCKSGQTPLKTETSFCNKIMSLEHYGCQKFIVQEAKKNNNNVAPRHQLGISVRGLFLFQLSFSKEMPDRLISSYLWKDIIQVAYDKQRFQISAIDSLGKVVKSKFHVPDKKAELMFILAKVHRHYFEQEMWNNPENSQENLEVEYKEPREKTIKSLKNRLLPKRTPSQRKMYNRTPQEFSTPKLKRNGSISSSYHRRRRTASHNHQKSLPTRNNETPFMVKRLTHYNSMADTIKDEGKQKFPHQFEDKENHAPQSVQNYRYKFYLEPDEDENAKRTHDSTMSNISTNREPLQERSLSLQNSKTPPPLPPKLESVRKAQDQIKLECANIQQQQQQPKKTPSTVTNFQRKNIRTSIGANTPGTNARSMRMGTRISASALHRERLRLTTAPHEVIGPPLPKKMSLDLDYGTMEFKSLLNQTASAFKSSSSSSSSSSFQSCTSSRNGDLVSSTAKIISTDSLSSDGIETTTESNNYDYADLEALEPERQIVEVTMTKGIEGHLGLKLQGTPNGIYIDYIDPQIASIQGNLQLGDRIVAINGRSLENVAYRAALGLIKKSDKFVHFLVSQVKQ